MYIFGPVASRRFGISLGIDLSPDKKRCNFDCLYCELDKAKPTTTYETPPRVDEIIKDVKKGIEKYSFDVLTITSNGEPTLYPYLDTLIDELKLLNKKLLILSNSSTIYKESIQNSLKKLDIVKLSLDAVTPTIFKKIDRPAKDINIEKIIDGIIKFRKIFKNELIIEILVVKGVNDKKEEFQKLNQVLNKISPDRVDISTIDRPPAFDVEPVDIKTLFELSNEIKNQHIFIPSRDKISYMKENLTVDEIINTFEKRPFSENDIKNIFDINTQKKIELLIKDKILEPITISNITFYKVKK